MKLYELLYEYEVKLKLAKHRVENQALQNC